ncbi:MAG: AmpG family muropeptide MFS transporter [Candidatus Adiutrix sp.]
MEQSTKTPHFFQRNLLTAFCMGFTSGVPLLIGLSLLQAWLTDSNIDIRAIGLMALISIPYSLKVLWAPWLDFYDPPIFGFLGRRRGWILLSQLCLMAFLWVMSFVDPTNLWAVGVAAFAICLASATQDVVVDAYRRDDLADSDLGPGSAYYQWGYRLGMLAVGSGGLIAADHLGWPWVFRAASFLLLIGPLTLMFSPEPQVVRPPSPTKFINIIKDPLYDFFRRPGFWAILAFIFFYKFGDQLATSLSTNYFLTLGYTKTDIGVIGKIFGTGATLTGVMLGGWGVAKMGMARSLWLFGFMQMVTTLGFVLLYYLPVAKLSLALIVCQENLASGAGTSAFVAFMASQTNRSFSATQYALLSSMMAIPRTVLSAPAGYLVAALNWPSFFLLSTALAIPGFVFLYYLGRRRVFAPPLNS